MSPGRRPALRLVPEPTAAPHEPVLGAVELLPGRVRGALLDMAGTVLWRAEAEFPAETADTGVVETVLAKVTRFPTPPLGIGVASAGLLDADAGIVLEVSEVPALHGFPIADVLSGLTGAPVFVEHRARLQVLGDRWFGPGAGRTTFASVSTGEVLGVGILYDGAVLAPPGGRSGAHMTVVARGARCTCGSRGCWKTVATTPWLRAEARRRGLAGNTVRALAGDPLLDEYAANIALGLVNIQQLFAPGLFILHGEAGEGGEPFRARIERHLREDSSWATNAEPPRVLVSGNAIDDIALLGGAGLVLSHQ